MAYTHSIATRNKLRRSKVSRRNNNSKNRFSDSCLNAESMIKKDLNQVTSNQLDKFNNFPAYRT